MTLWAERDGQQVRIRHTSGTTELAITEELAHLRSFWGSLGRVLEEAERGDVSRETPAEGP
jgi:hypothetical protein